VYRAFPTHEQSQEDFYNSLVLAMPNGVFEFDFTAVKPKELTPGRLRAFTKAIGGPESTGTEVTMFMALWQRLRKFWNSCTPEALVDRFFQMWQIHIQTEFDESGVPFCRLYARMKILGGITTPWRFFAQCSLNLGARPMRNHSYKDRKMYSMIGQTMVGPGLFGISFFHVSPTQQAGYPRGSKVTPRAPHTHTAGSRSKDSHSPVKSSGAGKPADSSASTHSSETAHTQAPLDDTDEDLFVLRFIEGISNGEEIKVSGYVNGLGKYEWSWKRIADCDRTLCNFEDTVEQSEGFHSCPVPSVILEAVRRQENAVASGGFEHAASVAGAASVAKKD
jgi:hypothetical protein